MYGIAEDKIEEFTKKIADIEKALAQSGTTTTVTNNSSVDMSAVDKLLNDYLKKSDMTEIVKRLEKVEEISKEAKDIAMK
jgi:hypothetical protein